MKYDLVILDKFTLILVEYVPMSHEENILTTEVHEDCLSCQAISIMPIKGLLLNGD